MEMTPEMIKLIALLESRKEAEQKPEDVRMVGFWGPIERLPPNIKPYAHVPVEPIPTDEIDQVLIAQLEMYDEYLKRSQSLLYFYINADDQNEPIQVDISRYCGYSNCRICGIENGSCEFKCPDKSGNLVCFPSGLLHYVRDHGVKVDLDLITGAYEPGRSMSDPIEIQKNVFRVMRGMAGITYSA